MSRGKTWVYWYNRITEERRKLCPDGINSRGLLPWSLSDDQRDQILLDYQEEVDLLCLLFSDNLKWASLSPETRCAVYYRLDHAFKLVQEFTVIFGDRTNTVVRPPDLQITPEPQVWKFLLIDWWKVEFRSVQVRQQRKNHSLSVDKT